MSDSAKPVVVIGAGAAGIFAAWRSAALGAPTILLEKTSRIGTKILISGGGKCNITHDGPIEDVLRAFRPNEARFIRPACYRFLNTEIVEMLTSRGLEVYTRPDGRIFPTTGTAKDVVAILRSYLVEAGVELRLNTPCTGISRALMVGNSRSPIEARAVVLATGGSSYPNSGTTGDGWAWAKELGHAIVPVKAALAPIFLKQARPDRAGVALRDIVLKVRHEGKETMRWRGDLLFTHRGVSGPTVLEVSRVAAENLELAPSILTVDLCPDLTFEALTSVFVNWTQQTPKKLVPTLLEEWLPKSLTTELVKDAGVVADTAIGNLHQKSRNRLIETLKAWPLGEIAEVVLDRGEVVAGGVSLDEVDSRTMASRLVPGLFLCGEVLDIAGPVGGYNLQAAFATGFVAGESAAGYLTSECK